MAAVVLQGTLQLSRQHAGVAAAAVCCIQSASFSSDVRVIKKPSLANMRKGPGGRSSFNGVIATVFGASGFLGRYVCNELGKYGTQLILPYRGDPYDLQRLKVVGDLGQVLFQPYHLCDEDSIRTAMKYSNVVVNLVGRDWETKNFKFDDVHVHGARRLARIAREEGIEKFIHISALNCSPNPPDIFPFGRSNVLKSKYFGELAVREEFPDAVIIRPSIMYGSEDRFFRHYETFWRRNFRSFPVWKKGLATEKMPVSVEDVASAVYAAIKDPNSAGNVYQAVGANRYLLHELVKWIMRELRRAPPVANYIVTDARFDPLFMAKLLFFEQLPGSPIAYMHREIIRRECTSDELDYNLLRLQDLGIKPEPLEHKITWLLKPYRRDRDYADAVGEFDKAAPAPTL